MTDFLFQKIIQDSQREILKLAKKNGWLWFYNLHQKEVIKCAKKLLKIYKKADRKIVLISCWFHDIAHYYARDGKEIFEIKKNHHIKGAKIAEDFLKSYKLNKEEILKIKNCVLRHRNKEPYVARSLEEKIVVVADTLSHFESIFYFTYFKFSPDDSLEAMVKKDLEKLDRDWHDLGLLPEARKLAENEYKVFRKLLKNYKK